VKFSQDITNINTPARSPGCRLEPETIEEQFNSDEHRLTQNEKEKSLTEKSEKNGVVKGALH